MVDRAMLLLVSLIVITVSPAVAAPPRAAMRVSKTEDIRAIQRVIEDFRSAIINKDGRKLSTHSLNSRILFTTPPQQAVIDQIRQHQNMHFDGIGVGYSPENVRKLQHLQRLNQSTNYQLCCASAHVDPDKDAELAYLTCQLLASSNSFKPNPFVLQDSIGLLGRDRLIEALDATWRS